ncbi:MarR family transcriptional regulator [Pseudonocardia kujensis]|uniref:MarR family winged helix-turn-helix transcriptional regulator n=1 Tax=Pseudonocardia kujensis TaxID=1128675 RepID=UPI001E4FFE12|nr:MarR family transcriptional regulator [Pseudonocardia kujensis]MCE0762051.1 MarR family transcriptional regulator [Pseudonocardia kujensis]
MATPDALDVAARLRACLGPLVRKVRGLREDGDLTLGQASMLARVAQKGPTTVASLAAIEMIRPQSAAQVVQALEAKGYVDRRTDPDDSRRLIVEVTSKGSDWVTDTREAWNGRFAAVIATELSAAEQRRLAAAIPLLERLREVL